MPFQLIKTKDTDREGWRNLHALVQFGKETTRFDVKPSGKDEDDEKNQDVIGTSIRVNNDDLPITFQGLKPGTLIEDVYVLMDIKSKKPIAINPWSGEFEAVCYELGSKAGRTEENLPQFQYVPAEESRFKKDEKNFQAYYEILEDTEFQGIFKGSKPRYYLQHLFVNNGHGMAGIEERKLYWKGTRTGVGKLLEWTVAHEIDGDMIWPDNGDCTPELERRILSINKPVRIRIDKGRVADVMKARGAAVRVVPEEEVEKPGESDPVFGKA